MNTNKLIKIILAIQCCAILCLFALTSSTKQPTRALAEALIVEHQEEDVQEKGYDIVLDAGHGGMDGGTQAHGLLEKNITLSMSKKIGTILEREGYRVCYTRMDDDAPWATSEVADLDYRVNVAGESGAKIMVSIHVNSEDIDYGSHGYEIWLDSSDQVSQTFAESILTSLNRLKYTQNRGIKDESQGTLHLVMFAKIPTILFEVGFLGNEKDEEYLRDGKKQDRFCQAVADGIIQSLKQME